MDPVKILDRLRTATHEIKKLQEAPSPIPEKEEILGLRYKRGQRVRDAVTGEEGEVIDAGVGVFQV